MTLDRHIINLALAIPEIVKSLDSIHIATAELVHDAIDYVLTYDRRMAAVLEAHGIPARTASDILQP